MSIGKRAKARRDELGWSVEKVAKATGIGVSTLYDLERETQATTKKISALAKALGLKLEFLEYGTGPRLIRDGTREPDVAIDMNGSARLVAAEWQKLHDRNPGIAQAIAQLVDMLVAARIREERPKKPGIKPKEITVQGGPS